MNLSSVIYKNFKELSKQEIAGRDFVITKIIRNSPILIMAPHGGRIELETTEIAKLLAHDKYSFYSFQGIKNKDNFLLHISSNNYQEPQALKMIDNSELVITIHGYRETQELIIVGGKNKKLRTLVVNKLKSLGFKLEESIPQKLKGTRSTNICNQGKLKAGLQLEISEGLRSTMKKNNKVLLAFTGVLQIAIDEYLKLIRLPQLKKHHFN